MKADHSSEWEVFSRCLNVLSGTCRAGVSTVQDADMPLTSLKGKKVKADIALHGNSISELRDLTCHVGSHSVTCHPTQVNAPRLTPAMQAGTRFTYLRGMEDWVYLVDLIVPRLGVEPVTFRSRVRRRTAAPPILRQYRYLPTAMWLTVWLLESFNDLDIAAVMYL